jgi:uncharacterized membrane protein
MDHNSHAATPRHGRWRPILFVRARPWLASSAAILLLAAVGLAWVGMSIPSALLLGFDLGAVVYLGTLLRVFNRARPDHLRQHAQAQDAGRWGTLWSAVALSVVVLVALATELNAAKGGGALEIVIAAVSILLSWLFMNSMFAVHYAHSYYGNGPDAGKAPSGGLDFPGNEQPDYWDFVYFAIVLGMTFQVSDVQVTNRSMRRTALIHSVIAFFFNVFIIAISVNIAAGQA